jgi:flagellar biosynthesis chaperone FliJ
MPSKDEMAQAYILQLKQKVAEIEQQLATLRKHVAECEEEFSEKESS